MVLEEACKSTDTAAVTVAAAEAAVVAVSVGEAKADDLLRQGAPRAVGGVLLASRPAPKTLTHNLLTYRGARNESRSPGLRLQWHGDIWVKRNKAINHHASPDCQGMV